MTGKWDHSDVPKSGWVCDGVEDAGDLRHTCEMCESASVRYIHYMMHESYPDSLLVGCVCAGNMEGSYESANTRENTYKKTARRRANWLRLSGWRRSQSGNIYINKDGLNVVVFRQRHYWSFRITHKESDRSKFSKRRYETEPGAQLAAFDAIVWLKERGWLGNL